MEFIKIMEFIFQSFWHFLGSFIIIVGVISVIFRGIGSIGTTKHYHSNFVMNEKDFLKFKECLKDKKNDTK